MHVSWNSTNAALEQRISETRVAKDNLDTHLTKTNQEIKDQEKEISTLTKALRDKEAPLKVMIEILRCARYMPSHIWDSLLIKSIDILGC